MLQECMESDHRFGVTLIKEGDEVGGLAIPHDVGTVARITQVDEIDGGRFFVSTIGQQRFSVLGVTQWTPFIVAEVRLIDDHEGEPVPEELTAESRDTFLDYARVLTGISGGWVRQIRTPTDPVMLSYHIARVIQADLADKQKLLEHDTADRLSGEIEIMQRDYTALRRQMTMQLISQFGRQ